MIQHYIGFHNTFAAGGLTIQKGPWKPSQNDFVRPLNQEHAGHLGWKETTYPGGTQTTIPQIKTNSVKYKHDTFAPKGKGLTASYSIKRGGRKGRLLDFADPTVNEEVFSQRGSNSPNLSILNSTINFDDRNQNEGGVVPFIPPNSFNASDTIAMFPNDDAVDDLLSTGNVVQNPTQPLVDHLQQQDQENSVANDAQIIQNTNAAVVAGDAAISQLGPQISADPGAYNPAVPQEVVNQQFEQFQNTIGGGGIRPTLDTSNPNLNWINDAWGQSWNTLQGIFPQLRGSPDELLQNVFDFMGISGEDRIPNATPNELLNVLKKPTVVERDPVKESVREAIITGLQDHIGMTQEPESLGANDIYGAVKQLGTSFQQEVNALKPNLSLNTTGMTPGADLSAAGTGREEWYNFRPRILKPDKKLNTTQNGKTQGVEKKKRAPRAQTRKPRIYGELRK